MSNAEVLADAERRLREHYGPLVKFEEMRRHYPTGQEWTHNLPLHPGATWNLHSGDDRGVTWHDRDADIVWLCAAGFHRSGQPDDLYNRAVELDGEDRLLPTADEINESRKALRPNPMTELAQQLPQMLKLARENPRMEISRYFDGVAKASVLVEVVIEDRDGLEEVSLGVTLVFPTEVKPGTDVFAVCVAVLFPAEPVQDMEFVTGFPHRSARPGERIVRVCRSL